MTVMKEITLKVPNKEYSFFIKLLESLGFVSIEKPKNNDSSEYVLNSIKKGIEEVKDIESGKKSGTKLDEFLDEL